MSDMTATYSPEDNKLRLDSITRLSPEMYARVRAAGFIWAPQQKIFVAPMWTPQREDLLIELCGEIGDEDTSLIDRAEDRAERFEDYSDSRAADAEQAHKAVEQITSGIPLGQPILVGHHSEKHARKDAERIENGMRRAVKMWETSKYWKQRAAGAIRHAKYKELPGVRARRIKSLGTDLRREQKRKEEHERMLTNWNYPGLHHERAVRIAGCDSYHVSRCFPLAEYPRKDGASKYEGEMSLYSALKDEIITAEQAKALAVTAHEAGLKSADRWIQHITNRIEYETAMLEEAGAGDLLKPKPKPKQLPLCNYRAPDGLQIENIYHRGEMVYHPQVEMTQAFYARINQDYKGTRVIGHSHRVRVAMQNHTLVCVFLTDAKVHTPPESKAAAVPTWEPRMPREYNPAPAEPQAAKFEDLREQLKAGIKVVSAPQLFPTPPDLARRMADEAGQLAGLRVLEPSAGTGNLVRAIMNNAGGFDCGVRVVAVEHSEALAEQLRIQRQKTVYANEANFDVRCKDFLECNGDLGKFDRVLMNPPFANGADIKHIEHALTFLKPGGKLVAICANGPRQNATLRPMVEEMGGEWEELPEGTFKEQGTGVRTVLLSVTAN